MHGGPAGQPPRQVRAEARRGASRVLATQAGAAASQGLQGGGARRLKGPWILASMQGRLRPTACRVQPCAPPVALQRAQISPASLRGDASTRCGCP